MLRGQALKSLEDVDSSKFLENDCYKNSNSLDVSSNLLIPDDTSQKNDKKNVVPKVKAAVSAASNAVAHLLKETGVQDECS
ncbi:hypothetical protein M0R45_035953 [Rubus argutus]|uniref:Uncharacterized protein n=1 Tax=Rubus argutus TaxID=59490 RepID=A0AAW1VXG6_RUBAR